MSPIFHWLQTFRSARLSQSSGALGGGGFLGSFVSPSPIRPCCQFPLLCFGSQGTLWDLGMVSCLASVFLVWPAGGWTGEPRTARHATQRGHGGAGAARAAAGSGGELGARPALCRRPRPSPARGCPAGPAPAAAAHECQWAERGPGW
jgi:hypothetical protein